MVAISHFAEFVLVSIKTGSLIIQTATKKVLTNTKISDIQFEKQN